MKGKVNSISKTTLAEAESGQTFKVAAVKDSSSEFLHYLMELQITLSTPIKVLRKIEFDNSIQILVNKKVITVSEKFAQNILIH
jgi:DtxR family Mn-dependent transcriptional regulator